MAYYSSVERQVTGMKLGSEFEYELVEMIEIIVGKNNCKSLCNTVDDMYKGQDAEIYGIPTDITVNFSGKDNMTKLPRNYPMSLTTVRYGVRTGNRHNGFTKFKKPVLVIGIDAGSFQFFKTWRAQILDELKKHIKEIIDVGQDQYWEWLDAQEGLA